MSCTTNCTDCTPSPCVTPAPVSASNESLQSALDNFILNFYGTITKSVVNGAVVWTLPCDLAGSIPNYPRDPTIGTACYFKDILTSIATAIPLLGTMATQNADAVVITGGSITGLSAPANPSDAATKGYVDTVSAFLAGTGLTLTGKTFSVNGTQTLTGGSINGMTVGNLTPSTVSSTGGALNGTLGLTTAFAAAATTLSVTGQITSTVASGTPPLVIASTTNVPNLNASSLNGATFASPGSIGSTVASSGAFTSLSASGSVSGAGFTTLFASPPSIGSTAPGTGAFTAITLSGAATLQGLSSPVNPNDAATKSYVDSVATGITPRTQVLVATTTNITLSGAQTIDGVAVVAGNRVLVKNQTLSKENGIYDAAAGAWTRSTDSNTAGELLVGYYYFVQSGTAGAATSWFIQTAPTVLDTDPVVFAQFAAAAAYVAGTGLTLTGLTFSVNGTQTLTGGSINGMTIGAGTPSTGAFTSLTSTSFGVSATPGANIPVILTPTATASAGSAIGVYNGATLVAAANSDALYGLYSTAVVSKGAFTGLTYYGHIVDTASESGAGTIATAYQLYIAAAPAATTKYGIYQVGTDPNVFGGSITAGAGSFTTLSATGRTDAAGGLSVQGTGAPSAGSGLEITGGPTPQIQAYNRTGAAFLPLVYTGSSHTVQVNSSTVTSTTSTGLAVTGAVSASTTITAAAASGYYLGGSLFALSSSNQTKLYSGSSGTVIFDNTGATAHGTFTSTGLAVTGAGNFTSSLIAGTSNTSLAAISFGGITSSFPALRYETANTIGAILADGSAYASFKALNATFTGSGSFTGNLGVGAAPNAAWALNVQGSQSGGGAGVLIGTTMTATANSQAFNGLYSQPVFARGTYTGLVAYNVILTTPVVSGTGTIANAYQLYIDAAPAATTKYGIYQAGTDDNLLSGKLTVSGKIVSEAIGNTGNAKFRAGGSLALDSGIDITDNSDTSGATFAAWRKANGTAIGTITRNGVTDAVLYNTTSDARLKTNVRDFTGADSGQLIDSLRPRFFDWKSGGNDAIGFIAQELNAADPAFARIGAVTVGDDDPNTIHQQWQRSDQTLVPILVAELQALRRRVAQLEQK